MIVQGPKIHEDFRGTTEGTKCEKHLGIVRKKKKIDLEAIGSRSNNALLDFLKCQSGVRSKQSSTNNNLCGAIEKSYASCHASVMGTGNYSGKKHCGDELKEWLECCCCRGQAATAKS
jgi:hypothetical protein